MDKDTLRAVLAATAVIVAALLAAIVAFISNIKIKQVEIKAQQKREKSAERLRFYLPLLRLSYNLDRRIGHILTTLDTDWLAKGYLDKVKNGQGFAVDSNERGYFILSSIYIFACFFGWSEAIKQGVDSTKSLADRGRVGKFVRRTKQKVYGWFNVQDKRNIFFFDPDISVVSKLFQYEELFNSYSASKKLINPIDACKLHKQFQYSIGELMIEKDGDKNFRCKSFREFFDSYVGEQTFRYWFALLENLFTDLCYFEKGRDLETQVKLKNDVRPLRLLAIRYWCRVLMRNMAEELDIDTMPPEEVLSGISESLQQTIKSVEIESLESYLLGMRLPS